MNSRLIVAFAGLAMAGGFLAGCTVSTPSSTVAPTASPPASNPPDPTASLSPTPSGDEMVGAFPLGNPVDAGARRYAEGDVEVDAAGTPIAYEGASGDIIDFVAERFGVAGTYLVTINQVRRGYTGNLYAGDTLNLDPHTIPSVGSINGEA